jgi:nicotinamidase-related amidase
VTQPIDSFNPAQTALLVMDYQNGILASIPDGDELVNRTAETIRRVRSAGATVGYVRMAFNDEDIVSFPSTNKIAPRIAEIGPAFHDTSPNAAVDVRIAPEPGDIVVRKTRVGPFSTTDLDDQLRSRGIDTLLLAGLTTSGVVLSVVRESADRDYRIVVISDLCADHDSEVHELLIGRVFLFQADVLTAAEIQFG